MSTLRQARDFLLAHRTDYRAAYDGFAWPKLGNFNWALDWFDAELARGPRGGETALWITGADAARLSFAELSARSSAVANGLWGLGARRGDRILLMLGNVAPLWEVMLAAMKLGCVVVPATTLLGAEDLAERVGRARVRLVVTTLADAAKLTMLGPEVRRITVGGAAEGSVDYASLLAAPADFVPDGVTRADDPLLLYFTSGTTSRPKLVLHSHGSYAAGHLSTLYWLGLRAGDVHLNISSPGWAKHAWSCFFTPWMAAVSYTHLTLPTN